MTPDINQNEKMNKRAFATIFIIVVLTTVKSISAQKSEIGVSVTLSGHFLFGPYYRYWFDDHNELDFMIPCACEGKGKVIFPSGIQAGYHYFFGDSSWRFSTGVQYSLFFGPKKDDSRKNLHIFSVIPGVQYRWNETKPSVEELLWISYFKLNGKQKISPTGLETKIGIKL